MVRSPLYLRIFRLSFLLFFSLTAYSPELFSASSRVSLLEHPEAESLIWLESFRDANSNFSPITQIFIHGHKGEFLRSFPVELHGNCLSSLVSPKGVILVFSKSLLELDLQTRKTKRLDLPWVPPYSKYLAASGLESIKQVLILNNQQELFIIHKDQTSEPTLLADLKNGHVYPFSSPNFIGLLQSNGEESTFYASSIVDHKINLTSKKISTFDFSNFALVGEELWLLPKKGRSALKWSVGSAPEFFELPEPDKKGFTWISFCEIPQGQVRLSASLTDFHLELPSQEDRDFPILLSSGSSEEALNQALQSLFFPLSMGLLIIWVLSVRKKTELSLGRKVQKTEPAHLGLRCITYWLDLQILWPIVDFLHLVFLGPIPYINLDTQNKSFTEILELAESFVPALKGLLIILTLVLIIYHAIMEYYFGGSLAKLFFRMKLLTLEGTRPSLKQIILKNICRPVELMTPIIPLPFGLISCFFSKKKQCIGDRLAKTVVVKESL